MRLSIGQQVGVKVQLEFFAEIVNQAVKLGKIVHGEFLRVWRLIRLSDQSIKIPLALLRFILKVYHHPIHRRYPNLTIE